MRQRCSLAVGLAAALFLSSVTTAAAEAPPSGTAAESVTHTVPAAAAARTAEYWTPERMAAAIPVESTDLTTESAQRHQQPSATPEQPTGPATTGSEPTAGTASGLRDDISAAVTATKVVGKVFFTARTASGSISASTAQDAAVLNAGQHPAAGVGHHVLGATTADRDVTAGERGIRSVIQRSTNSRRRYDPSAHTVAVLPGHRVLFPVIAAPGRVRRAYGR